MRRIARGGGGGDVLAAHALGVPAGPADHLAQPPRQRRLPGPDAQPGTRGETLPAAAATARAGRPGRVDHHVADLAGEARRADLDAPVDHDAAADAGAEGDHHDVAVPAGGAQAVLGQHGQVGVVLDDDRATRQPSPISSVQSTPWAWGRLGAKRSRPRRSTMPGHAHADRGVGAARRAERVVEFGHDPRHRGGHVAAHDRAAPGRRGDPGLGDDVVAAPRATPRTLVPPMSTP